MSELSMDKFIKPVLNKDNSCIVNGCSGHFIYDSDGKIGRCDTCGFIIDKRFYPEKEHGRFINEPI